MNGLGSTRNDGRSSKSNSTGSCSFGYSSGRVEKPVVAEEVPAVAVLALALVQD